MPFRLFLTGAFTLSWAAVLCLTLLCDRVEAQTTGGDDVGPHTQDDVGPDAQDNGNSNASKGIVTKQYFLETRKRFRELGAGLARLTELMTELQATQSSDVQRVVLKDFLGEIDALEPILRSLITRVGWIERQSNREVGAEALNEIRSLLAAVHNFAENGLDDSASITAFQIQMATSDLQHAYTVREQVEKRLERMAAPDPGLTDSGDDDD